ncbi:MAG: D-alanyl-D-alanine carboxypeptidase/D-alanyl-D-alanine-endopeptidase [Bacteroidetes bacterium RIFCSPHIGHO2_02_FULL_44_7]|nr:MAG: D-alanyl-D-alanine carboxypeptidase/D-alanyl-D-alanine-endopeptidase [Bacteroidetes bacterium RIFCSPHIGHO2_02_FULL_44_7]
MKILRLILFLAISLLNSVSAQNPIQLSIDRFAADPSMSSASITFKVVDLDQGNTVAEYQPFLTMPTASIAKLFSTATALELLGPDFRAQTRLYHDGTIDSLGVLHGNLWIRGGGDPSLGSKYFHEDAQQLVFLDEWIAAVKKAGIKGIDGAVYADASEFGYEGAPDGWSWSDMGNYYGAGPSGLTIYDNQLSFHFNVPSALGSVVKVKSMEPEVPGLVFHNYILSSSKSGDNAYLYGAPYSLDRFGSGTLPAGSSSFLVKGSLPDPEWQVAYEFDKALRAAGITISGDIQTARTNDLSASLKRYESMHMVHTHKGEKLLDIVSHTNMRSVNLFAEHMVNLIGYDKTGNGSTSSGLTVLEDYWKSKFNTNGMHVNDGSGLSRSNAWNADHFVQLLKCMHTSKYAAQFKSTLPVAGSSGTLRNICAGGAAKNRMQAKSGSMTRIKSYAGYIQSASGKNYCFALIVNNASCSNAALLSKMESVFNTIATY